ncbi:MAG: rod shape-determining protein MreC [Patescibacteria group bacterium]
MYHTKRRISSQAILLYIITMISLVLFELVGWSSELERLVSRAVIPLAERTAFQVRVVTAPLSSIAVAYRAQTNLEVLQQNHAVALAKLSQLEQLEKENEELRQLIENRHLDLSERIVVTPIASYTQPTLSAGAEQGVRTGQLVSSNGVLLGRVRSVSDRQAAVELLIQPSVENVIVQLETGEQGVLEGRGSFAVVTHLQQGTQVEAGMRITTLGQPGIPQGILVGVVGRTLTDPTAPFVTAQIDQLTSFYTAALVEVW